MAIQAALELAVSQRVKDLRGVFKNKVVEVDPAIPVGAQLLLQQQQQGQVQLPDVRDHLQQEQELRESELCEVKPGEREALYHYGAAFLALSFSCCRDADFLPRCQVSVVVELSVASATQRSIQRLRRDSVVSYISLIKFG